MAKAENAVVDICLDKRIAFLL